MWTPALTFWARRHANTGQDAQQTFQERGSLLSRKCQEVHQGDPTIATAALIKGLNPRIRGWANYHRRVVSGAVFAYVDHEIWKALWRWTKRRHPNKGRRWVKEKYFPARGGRHWVPTGTKRVPMARNGKSTYSRRAPCTSKGMSSFAGPQIPLTLSGARTLTDGVAAPLRVGRKLSARRIVLSHRQQNRRTACPVRLDIPSGSRCLSPMIRQNHVGFLGEEAVATPSHLSHPTG